MTGKRTFRQKLLICKVLWYVFGVAMLLVGICFLVIPALTKFSLLLTLYELAAEKGMGMLLVWYIYFVVLVLVILLDAFVTLAIGTIFFSKLREAAFESIEKLLRGEGLSLSR